MNKSIFSNSLSIFFLSLVFLLSSCSKNETDPYKNAIRVKSGIVVSGDQQVPAVSSSGSAKLDISYDPNSKLLSYNVRWINMPSNVIAMHFHGPASRGVNAGVLANLTGFTESINGQFTGKLTLNNTTQTESDLLAGKWYLNIHTVNNANGELRAQIEF